MSQGIAISIENLARRVFEFRDAQDSISKFGGVLNADLIRMNLMQSLSIILSKNYTLQNVEYRIMVDNFLMDNRDYINMSIDEVGSEKASELVDEVRVILDNLR